MALNKSLNKPRSIRFYSVLYLGITVLVFILAAVVSLYSINRVNESLEEVKNRNAKQEIAHTIDTIIEKLDTQMASVAAWDEVHQQLRNPAYYAYVKEHRLLGGNPYLGSDYLLDIEIYNINRESLIQSSGNGLPGTVPEDPKQWSVISPEGYFTKFRTITQKSLADQQERVVGYLGVSTDLLSKLENERMNFSVQGSIRLDDLSGPISIEQLADNILFQLPENLDYQFLLDVVKRTLMFVVLGAMILSFAFYTSAIRLLERPLDQLLKHLKLLKDSGDGAVIMDESLNLSELEEVRVALNDYQHTLTTANQQLWEKSYHDVLTGCLNRRAFEEDMKSLQRTVPGSRSFVSQLLFDCNHFKAINDTYGHDVGDFVLKSIGTEIQSVLRAGDKLYRIGGDEFVLIMLHADATAADNLARRCLEKISRLDFVGHKIREPIRVSIGVASTLAESAEALRTLHQKADIAMYHAKRPDNANIVHFTDEMNEDLASVLSSRVISAVHDAITLSDNIAMHYQPILDFASGSVKYFEALVRIRDENGIISPAEIFQVVDNRGLEREFDRAVLRAILRDLESGSIPEGMGLSINLSGPCVIEKSLIEWMEPFEPFLQKYKIQLEVTETTLIRQLHTASNYLDQLRSKGFLVALDDFGSGYSSMRYLATMPVDLVKFDITLIRDLNESSRQRKVIEGLADVILNAGFPLVAEGIESEQMLERVRSLGFTYAQGYLIGRPQPAADLLKDVAI
jgi:diguanylate cyclase (GGDEF)-like protein